MDLNDHQSDVGKEFSRLLSKHRNSIYSFILTLVANWSDAEDLMQETAEVMCVSRQLKWLRLRFSSSQISHK